MSDGPSDPDLDFSDLPDTAGAGPLVVAVKGLGRWARRQAGARRELRAWALGAVLSIAAGAIGVIWRASALNSDVDALREDMREMRATIDRIDERQWLGPRSRLDTTTHATGGE